MEAMESLFVEIPVSQMEWLAVICCFVGWTAVPCGKDEILHRGTYTTLRSGLMEFLGLGQ